MSDTDADALYHGVIARLRELLALCDDRGVGAVALPHLDLALNLLVAEHRATAMASAAWD